MTEAGLKELDFDRFDLVIVENLMCLDDFDIWAVCNVMILSVPEGDDKPLKYPLMFLASDVLLVQNNDYLQLSDFYMTALKE